DDSFFLSSRRRHTRFDCDWSSDVCSSDLIEYDSGFTLPPGRYSLRFVARENTTGKIGTYDTKFVVPDLTTEQQRLPISSVILSKIGRASCRERVYAGVVAGSL